jgi:hypothetical protein
MFAHNLSCHPALLHDRVSRKHLGDESDTPLVDQLHHAMQLWKEEKRGDLVNYLRKNELLDHVPYWKLAQALFEVLPRDEKADCFCYSPLALCRIK